MRPTPFSRLPVALGLATASLAAGVCDTSIEDPVLRHAEGAGAPGTGAAFQAFGRPNVSEEGHLAFTAETNGPLNSDDVVYVDDVLVAREGDPAPGTAAVYGTFEFLETGHQVNGDGEIVYIANLLGAPSGSDRAIFRDAELVARSGTEAPGIPGRHLVDFGFAGVTDSGEAGYLADLDGSPSDDSVIYRAGVVLYRQGELVPGLAETTWDGDFDELQWNGNGDVLFEGNTSLGADDRVVFRRMETDGAIVEEIVAQENMPIDASTGPDALELVLQTALAENGDWALRGNLVEAGSDFDAVVLSVGGFLAQQGDPVAGFPGLFLGNFNGVDLNSNGDVLYLADLAGDVTSEDDEGLFVNGCLVVRTGDDVPGLAGHVFTDIGFEDVFLNDAGVIVFAASYNDDEGPARDGIFTVSLDTGPNADLDGDGDVDASDLALLLDNWGDDGLGDLDGNGEVDGADLGWLLAQLQ